MTRARILALVPLALALAACSGGTPDAVQSAYDACYKDGGELGPILKIDGSSLVVDVGGEIVKGVANSDLAASLLIVTTVTCLADETGFPGKPDALKAGDEWDGWRYESTEGAGSSFTMRFTAR